MMFISIFLTQLLILYQAHFCITTLLGIKAPWFCKTLVSRAINIFQEKWFYYIITALGYFLKTQTWFRNPTPCPYRIKEIDEFSSENDITTESRPRAIPKRSIKKSTLQNQNHQAIYKGSVFYRIRDAKYLFGKPLRATESRTFLPHVITGGAPCIEPMGLLDT